MNFLEEFPYRVIWSEDDQEYVGLCDGYPSCSWLSSDPHRALAGIKCLIREINEDEET